MKVLVTGSSGQLGGEICRQLAAAGSAVIGLDRAPGPTTGAVGDVVDRALVARLAAEVDAVVHTASLHAPHVATRSKSDFIDTNVTGTLVLLEAAAAAGHRRFVYTSTTSVFGAAMVPIDRAVWVTEDLAPEPRDIYDLTKLSAEALCRLVAAERGMAISILRTSRFYDEGPERMAIHRLHRGGDVRDIAAAHLLALEREAPGCELFIVSGRSPFQRSDAGELWRDAAAVIRRTVPEAEAWFARRGWNLPARIDRVYDIGRAERLLGYRPRFDLASLLAPERRHAP
ncbi:MAG TPA: NAD(P)-dependent oxidoreductase [Kofleriaceae bacterium]|nr:NAD(P)-dependent oxidoreductase [Kofleriaceae bacterium]